MPVLHAVGNDSVRESDIVSSHLQECPKCQAPLRIAPHLPDGTIVDCPDCHAPLELKRTDHQLEILLANPAAQPKAPQTVTQSVTEHQQSLGSPKSTPVVGGVIAVCLFAACVGWWLIQPGAHDRKPTDSEVTPAQTQPAGPDNPQATVGPVAPKNTVPNTQETTTAETNTMEAPEPVVPKTLSEQMLQRLEAIAEPLEQRVPKPYQTAAKSVPQGTSRPLSWIAELVARQSQQVPDWSQNWDAPANDAFVRQAQSQWLNPLIPNQVSLDRYPSTHFVGLGGVWEETSEGQLQRRHGMFSPEATQTEIDQANTIAVVGINENFPSWADASQSTRWMRRAPYINGPDHIGSGQLDGMHVLMADGSVRFLSDKIDTAVLQNLASRQKQLPPKPQTIVKNPKEQVPQPQPIAPELLEEQNALRAAVEQRLSLTIQRYIQGDPVPLRRMLIEFEALLGVRIEFDDSIPADDPLRMAPISFHVESITVGELFSQVLTKQGLKWKWSGRELRITQSDSSTLR